VLGEGRHGHKHGKGSGDQNTSRHGDHPFA